MTALTVFVTRDSVTAGDDFDAPHPYSFKIKRTAKLGKVFEHLANKHYLASVAGRGHSWQAKIGDHRVADFVANNRRPTPSGVLALPLADWADLGRVDIHFSYRSATY